MGMRNRIFRVIAGPLAKQLMKGMVMEHASRWRIEDLRTWPGTRGVHELIPEQWHAQVREWGEQYPALREELTSREFLEWMREGNPLLFSQILQETFIIDWIVNGWEAAREALFEKPSSP